MTKWCQYFPKGKEGGPQAVLLEVNSISISEILTGRQMRLQPVPDVLIDRLAHGAFIEDLVSQTGIQLHSHIRQARLAEGGGGAADALTHIAHRVPVAGDQQHRQAAVHAGQILGVLDAYFEK